MVYNLLGGCTLVYRLVKILILLHKLIWCIRTKAKTTQETNFIKFDID